MSIWRYKKHLEPKVKTEHQLTLGEGDTPCIQCNKLSKALGIDTVYIKREDLNPTGSFKDRSLAFQLSAHYHKGNTNFVISSSGNAAISAISYCKLFKCQLTVFVSKQIPKSKLNRLLTAAEVTNFSNKILQHTDNATIRKNNIEIIFSQKPRSDLIKFLNKNKAIDLRGSRDDLAITGFKTIAYELVEQTKNIDAIFIPCSSGTSTVGVYKGFKDLGIKSPQIHIIQTTKVHPIAKKSDKNFKKSETSLASAIVDKVAHRKEQVLEIIQKTNGSGWVISDKKIKESQKTLQKHCNIKTSADSALSFAGLKKALTKNFTIKRPVLILSGK